MEIDETDQEAEELGIGAVVQGPESQEQKAYESEKRGHILFGEELRPYSPSRKIAAQSMGMVFPFLSEAAADQHARTGSYAGQLKDVIIVLWLCTLKDPSDLTKKEVKAQVWTPSRAGNKPELAMEVAMAWAVENGIIDTDKQPYRDAKLIWQAIIQNISASEFRLMLEEPDLGGLPSEKEEGGADPKP